MENIISKADYQNNKNVLSSFKDDRTPIEIITDNFKKGLIDEDTFNKAKEQLDNLIKGKGAGSRGGKVIGYTKSGKPVYEKKDSEQKSGLSADEKKKQIGYHDFMHEFYELSVADIDKLLNDKEITSTGDGVTMKQGLIKQKNRHKGLSNYHKSEKERLEKQ